MSNLAFLLGLFISVSASAENIFCKISDAETLDYSLRSFAISKSDQGYSVYVKIRDYTEEEGTQDMELPLIFEKSNDKKIYSTVNRNHSKAQQFTLSIGEESLQVLDYHATSIDRDVLVELEYNIDAFNGPFKSDRVKTICNYKAEL